MSRAGPTAARRCPLNGNLVAGQLFAIDWKRTNDQGAFYTGDKHRNQSYVDYGSPILAVADGVVTATLDGQEANAPGVLPADSPVLGPKLTVKNVDGNHIVLRIGDNAYAFYAHLLSGSLRVKVGDRVRKGQVIARLGNTGNANASHLHFHVMNGPSVLGSSGIPYVHRLVPVPGPDLPAAAGERRRLPHRRLLRPGASGKARAALAPAALGVGHRELPRLSPETDPRRRASAQCSRCRVFVASLTR